MSVKGAALSTAFAGAALAAAGTATGCDVEYMTFLKAHPNKAFSPEKQALFCKSLDEVSEFNQKDSAWKMEINEFADWTEEDLSVLGTADDSNVTSALPYFEPEVPEPNFPERPIDWRNNMPPAKDQGKRCGSCWAFATIAIIDFQVGHVGTLGKTHSEQQLIDCDMLGRGCNGGKVGNALQYFRNTPSVLEEQYPYTGDSGACRLRGQIRGPMISKYGRLSDGHASGADRMMHFLQNQVIAVEIDFTPRSALRYYGTGIFDSDCGRGGGHSMAAVGYSKRYWIIRNSWGSWWGQGGHVYFEKGVNRCSIETRGPIAAEVYFPRAGSSGAEVVV